MKKYNVIIILGLIFCFSASQVMAQKGAPGLYGKRLFIELGTGVVTSIELPRYNENNREGYVLDNLADGVSIPMTLNFNYQLSAHYALSRLSTAGIGVSYGRTGFDMPNDNPRINANIASTNLNFFFRRYYLSTGSIAPIGRYYQFGVSAMFNRRSFSESSLFFDDPIVISSQVHTSPAINLEFGRETVLNDLLLYSFAFQNSYVFSRGMDGESRSTEFEPISGTTMFNRLFSYYFFRFKFAVGLATLKMKK